VKLIFEQFETRPKEETQAYLDAANEFGNTGLHWAALGGHLDTVKLLMDSGASPALANDKNYVPLDLASFNDKFDVVDYFLAKTEGMEGENEEGLTMSAGDMSVGNAEEAS
jgi:ankyrin repeat protein